MWWSAPREGSNETRERPRPRITGSATHLLGGRSVAVPPVATPRLRPAPKPWPDPRRLTARQMAELGHRLYVAGYLDLGDSRLVSAQTELHPDYPTTIGRLTGCPPAPDKPRDQVEDWERRLAFALRYTPDNEERIGRFRRILAALGRVAAATVPSVSRMRE